MLATYFLLKLPLTESAASHAEVGSAERPTTRASLPETRGFGAAGRFIKMARLAKAGDASVVVFFEGSRRR